MALFNKKKQEVPQEPKQESKTDTVGKINLSLRPDEIDLLRECMKRTEDYYRGLLLLKQDWNAEKNEAAIAVIKVKLNMIDRLRKRHCMTASRNTIATFNKQKIPPAGLFFWECPAGFILFW